MMQNNKAVIVSFARTPIAKFRGSLTSKKATELGSIAIKGALSRTGNENAIQVSEAFMGNVVSAGIGQAPCRQAGKVSVYEYKTILLLLLVFFKGFSL